jgi:D-alanyl-D-alanine carboxypeptidase
MRCVVLGLFMVLAGCGAGLTESAARAQTLLSSQQKARFADALERAVERGLPGAALCVRSPNGEFSYAAGVSDVKSQRPMRPDHLFRIASNSKTFLGLVAAEMHVEGKLDLDQPISKWLPRSLLRRIANAERVTLRQLLQHRSGIPEYVNDHFLLANIDNPRRDWNAREALAFAEGIDADFAPGTAWKYSNTNYVLAGLVIDQVAGRHHSREIRDRILRPLGLRETTYWRKQPLSGELARGYIGPEGAEQDVTDLEFARGLADGGMIASVSNLAHFVAAVGNDRMDGALPFAARQELFRDLVPIDHGGYGLGVQVFEFGDDERVAIGHGGALVGYRSEMFYVPELGVSVAIATNRSKPSEVFDDLVAEVLTAILNSRIDNMQSNRHSRVGHGSPRTR